ncbi:hypothetical protein TraAM80_04945 [Trypanosoma rangeli]|uniref:Uncharacterized protein n=1 Tax=Trypanosoma rangeli TaxID=5698 RepID=A0A3R7KMJ4_TRYRA|nr:uncharacterized protein TraAM80_04945 [Trypanosoma rangeli]RNF04650.1 hypothetical protein TraAM80_04945 [Trypanosoma rangeli]|eukprot:RNF04650.1 hypothetical protein TraAM80_04945 [Trypanosoma rangeli]
MSVDPPGLGTNITAGAAIYMKEIILQNEALLLEVEQLRFLVKEKGLDQLRQLREENEGLRQQLKLSESQLVERTHQLEVLESAYDRFDGVHTVVQELADQQRLLSEMREQSVTLEEQNAALKTELLKMSGSEDELRRALQEAEQSRQMLETKVIELHASMEEMKLRLEIMETSKCAAERALEEAKAANTEMQAHAEALQEKCEALNTRLCDTKRKAEETFQIKTEKQIKLEIKLQEELRVAKEALVAQQQEASKALLQQRNRLEQTLRQESAELRRTLEAKEQSLREQVRQNMIQKEEIALLNAEKESMKCRQQELPTDLSRLKNRLKELTEETSKKEALQQRFQQMLTSTTATNSDIKHLFEQMLDYQERRDEEMLTMVAVEQIKRDDMKNAYEVDLEKLRTELKTLTYEIHTLQCGRAPAVAERKTAVTSLVSCDTAQHEKVAMGASQTRRPQTAQTNAKLPMPLAPNKTPGPSTRTGGSGGDDVGVGGGNDSNIIDDLWCHPPQRASGGHATAQHHPAPLRSSHVRHPELLVCSRCTLVNKPGKTLCDVCGASLRKKLPSVE